MKKIKQVSLVCLILAIIIIFFIVRKQNSFENVVLDLKNNDISILKIFDSKTSPVVFYSQFKDDISYIKYKKSLFGYKEKISGVQGISEFVSKMGFSVVDIHRENDSKSELILFGLIDKEKIDYIKLQLNDGNIIPNIYLDENNAIWYQILEFDDYENLDSVMIQSYKNGMKYTELDYELEK